MTFTLPTSSRNCRGSRPRTAAHQRPSGRSHSTRTDPSTITSPTPTRSRTQIRPGIHGADLNTPNNHSPPRRLTQDPVQISGSRTFDLRGWGVLRAARYLRSIGFTRRAGTSLGMTTQQGRRSRVTRRVGLTANYFTRLNDPQVSPELLPGREPLLLVGRRSIALDLTYRVALERRPPVVLSKL
jgi:hypothetical protein